MAIKHYIEDDYHYIHSSNISLFLDILPPGALLSGEYKPQFATQFRATPIHYVDASDGTVCYKYTVLNSDVHKRQVP